MQTYKPSRLALFFWSFCFIKTVILVSIVLSIAWPEARGRAMVLMGGSLIPFWIMPMGYLSFFRTKEVISYIRKIPLPPWLRFTLGCTVGAMLEEVVTVTATNAAPFMGTPIGTAFITPSTNYFDVICFHSVVVFVPMFLAWSWLRSRYAFTPAETMTLLGILGWISETVYSGGSNAILFGFWILVYGFMVYLSALADYQPEGKITVRWYHYILAIIIPYLAAFPVALVISNLHPFPNHFTSL